MDPVETASKAWNLIIKLISTFNSKDKRINSNISDIVNQDLGTFCIFIFHHKIREIFAKVIQELPATTRNPDKDIRPGNLYNSMGSELRFVMKDVTATHGSRMFEDKADYENATDFLSTFIFLKTGAELVETTNIGQIKNHCTEQNSI